MNFARERPLLCFHLHTADGGRGGGGGGDKSALKMKKKKKTWCVCVCLQRAYIEGFVYFRCKNFAPTNPAPNDVSPERGVNITQNGNLIVR